MLAEIQMTGQDNRWLHLMTDCRWKLSALNNEKLLITIKWTKNNAAFDCYEMNGKREKWQEIELGPANFDSWNVHVVRIGTSKMRRSRIQNKKRIGIDTPKAAQAPANVQGLLLEHQAELDERH